MSKTFTLPKVQFYNQPNNNLIYFSCDKKYFMLYGKALIKSIIYQIDWISVHVHLILKEDFHLIDFLDHPRVSYSYEYIDNSFIETIPFTSDAYYTLDKYEVDLNPEVVYYSCARFMQLPYIFPTAKNRILQIDCDSLLFEPFTAKDFASLTSTVSIMRKPKDKHKIIASAMSFGKGKNSLYCRNLIANMLTSKFSKKAYWFIDQICLQEIFNKNLVEHNVMLQHWNTWSFKKKTAFFRTGKGNKKHNNTMYIENLEYWKNI